MDLQRLQDKFPASQVTWRVARESSKGDKVQVLAYLENRDIMYRLDSVCGQENWRNEYKEFNVGDHKGVICGISININGEWITKWDGAESTNVEGFKGGLSDSMKRAAVQWGIGRYLYYLDSMYATLLEKGEHFHECKNGAIKYWNTPDLPAKFLP